MPSDMWEQIGSLHDHHAHVSADLQMLKLSEEVGEAAEAYIGMLGANNRKGVSHTREDVLSELADVIITAAVAMAKLCNGDREEAATHLKSRLDHVVDRALIPAEPSP